MAHTQEECITNLLSMAQRARRIVSGAFAVEQALKGREAVLVFVAADASDETKKDYTILADRYKVPYLEGLDRETLGVPVVAVGVPLVVYASTIAADALCALGEGEVEEERIAACVERVVSEKLGEMIVTPREVDALVERMAGVLADGINQALHPRLSRDEIAQMMAQ